MGALASGRWIELGFDREDGSEIYVCVGRGTKGIPEYCPAISGTGSEGSRSGGKMKKGREGKPLKEQTTASAIKDQARKEESYRFQEKETKGGQNCSYSYGPF